MTPERLASLPAGTIILYDGEMGEIIKPGVICHIIWTSCTSIIRTNSWVWQDVIQEFQEEV